MTEGRRLIEDYLPATATGAVVTSRHHETLVEAVDQAARKEYQE